MNQAFVPSFCMSKNTRDSGNINGIPDFFVLLIIKSKKKKKMQSSRKRSLILSKNKSWKKLLSLDLDI